MKNQNKDTYQSIPEGWTRESQPCKSKEAKTPEFCGRQLRGVTTETPDTDTRGWFMVHTRGCPLFLTVKKAFTLIELLVVILIIGILAAIAIVQYDFSVKKSQFTKWRILADSLAKAVQVYYMNQGDWPHSFDILDISVPVELSTRKDMPSDNLTCAYNEEMYCCILWPKIRFNSGIIICGKESFKYGRVYANQSGDAINRMTCTEWESNNFCKRLAGARRNDSTGTVDPKGWKIDSSKVFSYNID